jgi:DNA-binding transcriptional LysR family regulator
MKALQATLPGLVSAVQTAESGSFTAAARVLDLTPAAVSKNVAALEARLGLRLFNRTTRQLSPTAEGRRFLAQAREGLQVLEQAGEAAAADGAPEGLVRVSCGVGFGRAFVLPALPAFFARHTQVSVELSLGDQRVDLVRDGFDVGIRGGVAPPQGMVARKLCDIPHVLVAAPAYLRAHGTPAHWEDLPRHRLVALRFQSGHRMPWVFAQGRRRFTLEPQGGLTLSSPEALVDAALAGLGIAGVALHHAYDALSEARLVPVLPGQFKPGSIEMAVYYPHRRGLAPRVKVLVDHLVAHLTALPALQARTPPRPVR